MLVIYVNLIILSIWIGKCFDRFRFDGANKSESARNLPSIPASNLQNPSIPQGSNANWLISLFPWKKGSKTSKQFFLIIIIILILIREVTFTMMLI